MNWNSHSKLKGCHAFLSASKYHWLNYDEDHLIETYLNYSAAELGTRLHAWAADAIELGRKQPKTKETVSMYINDGINFGMTPETVLYYSDNCFGTADTISFKKNFLRIHDLKTGVTPAHMEQLMIYAALFCLEYHYKPSSIGMELRIYQNNEIIFHNPEPEEIEEVQEKIIAFDKIIQKLKDNGNV